MPMLTSPEGLVSSLACPEMSIREGSATAGGRGRDGRREMREGGRERREGGREGASTLKTQLKVPAG